MLLTKTINGIQVDIIDNGYSSCICFRTNNKGYTTALDEYISGELYSWLIQLGFEEVI